MVGGGSQDTFFCQTVADLTERTVIAGPAEATLLGNLLVGARAVGAVKGPIREVVRASVRLQTYDPRAAQRSSKRLTPGSLSWRARLGGT